MEVTTRLTWNEEKSLQKLLGSVSLSLLYKSSVHGCSLSKMFARCNHQGSTITVIYLPKEIVGVFIRGHYPTMDVNFGKPNSSFYFSLKNDETEIKTAFLNTTLQMDNEMLRAYHPNFKDIFSLIPNDSLVRLHSLLVNELRVNFKVSKYLECEVFRVEGIEDGNSYISRITGAAQHRHKLLANLRAYKPSEDLVSEIRILLLGPVGSGKSSFFNSVKSVFQGYVTHQAAVGSDSTSITELYRIYSIKDGKDGESLPFKLCDSMGLDEKEGAGLCMDDIRHILKGCMPDRYHFNPQQPITSRHPSFITSPSWKDRIHCVAYVLDSRSINILSSKMVEKLKRVQKEVLNCGIQQVVLLTNVTNYQEVLQDDFLNMKKCVTSGYKITEVQEMLHIPTSNILMVENYASELELNPLKDILILSALRQMLRAADDYLDDLPFEETDEVVGMSQLHTCD
ncbi:interferon induced protein 44 like [Phyllostomus discolor]|uniref:Interferon-induced protein 44-like n=1 Tax=Phyllostomus discolor TaxID=89673 RepID=A0A6J2LHZ1_9CHIR|nr:interferon-induced protein 44-like [Phyllostomus discolor]KAF6109132.1 interferon induced protein 44 like [Phyllostomus discolor]